MIGGIVIKKSGPTPGVLAKERRRIQKASFFKIGTHWHREFLPLHFRESAYHRYPEVYFRRSRKYDLRKRRKFGHANPLEYTGESRRLTNIRDVRATSNGNRVVIHARKFNFKNRNSKVNMRREVTFINDREEAALGGVFDDTFQRGVNTITARSTTKVS